MENKLLKPSTIESKKECYEIDQNILEAIKISIMTLGIYPLGFYYVYRRWPFKNKEKME